MIFLSIIVKKSFAEIKDINIDAGLKESFTKASGKYESKSLLNNCIINSNFD